MQKKYVMQSTHKNMRGFEYLVYSAFSLVLVTVLVLLPLAPVFAAYEDATPEIAPQTEISEPEETVEEMSEETNFEEMTDDSENHESFPQEEVQSEVLAVEESIPESTEEPIDFTEVPTQESSTDLATDDVSATDEAFSENTTTEIESEETVLGVATTSESSTDTPLEETAPPSLEVVSIPEDPTLEQEDTIAPTDDVVIQETSTSSEEVLVDEPQVTVVNAVTNDENRFSFSKDECASVGDGSFYCSLASTTPEVQGADRVFSAADADGDREIYVEKDGALIQITSNQVDDDAPFYDEISDVIVWHRLVNAERYQIIIYDVEDGTETQITSERYNNMEPSRYGDVTVWQGWVGSDWEVMLDEDGELTMLTDNTTQDISPRINGNYIMWQSFEDDAWRVKVYDRLTKQTETIADADGASLDNPRFVLIYDTKHENGDIETKGYDLESGEVMPLTATPAPIPEEIPDPEQTGEERALVSPSTQPKSKIDGEENDDLVDSEEPIDTDPSTIVIPPFISATSTEIATDTDSIPLEIETSEEISEYSDIVVPPAEEEIATSTNHIDDVIIAPFVEPIESTDITI